MPYSDKAILVDVNGKPIPQIWDEAGDQFVPYEGNVTLSGRSTSKEVNATATTTNQTAAFDVVWISHIVNDGTVDLYVAFDADSTIAANRITIKPGEILEDLPRTCSVLHYSCASGTCPFRAVGVK